MPTVTKPKHELPKVDAALVAEANAALDEVRRVKAIYATFDPKSRAAAETRRHLRQMAGKAKRHRLKIEASFKSEFVPSAALAFNWKLLVIVEQEAQTLELREAN
jgi:hypothetical protein